jgi:hypothetical protein
MNWTLFKLHMELLGYQCRFWIFCKLLNLFAWLEDRNIVQINEEEWLDVEDLRNMVLECIADIREEIFDEEYIRGG